MASLGVLRGFSGDLLCHFSGAPLRELRGAERSEAPRSGCKAYSLDRATGHEESEGECELQSASLLLRCVKRCFAFIPLARVPFLLSQVFVV